MRVMLVLQKTAICQQAQRFGEIKLHLISQLSFRDKTNKTHIKALSCVTHIV